MTSAPYEGIIVLGMPRSGTTLMHRILNAHSSIHCPPERYLLSACSRFLHEEPGVRGLNIGVLPGLHFDGYSEDEILGRLREFAVGIFRESASKANKPLWAEKTAFDIFHLDNIERLFAQHCRFICLTRHGLDVAVSIRELCEQLDLIHAELRPFFDRYHRPLVALCHAWVDRMQRLQVFHQDHLDQAFLLRYEDLVTQPHHEITRLFDFLEQPADVEQLLKQTFATAGSVGIGDWKTFETNTMHTSSIGRWKDLPTDLLKRLSELVNPTLVALGYEAVEVQQESEEEARRRFQIGRMVKQLQANLPKKQ